MSVSPTSSPMWAQLFGDAELSALLDDAALIGAMTRVEAALAEACAAAGLIPLEAARAIRAGLDAAAIDPSDLAEAAARDGVPVAGLVARLRQRLPEEAASYVHWGATSQDIVDSATVLQLSRALGVIEARTISLLGRLADLAEAEAATVMAARTRTQIAMPTTFGAVAAGWGDQLAQGLDRLERLRPSFARLSLHGAAGTDAALADKADVVRAHMGRALGLAAPAHPWHTARDGMAELGAALTLLSGALARIGLDIALLAQGGIAEIAVAGGASSTMPHKANPVAAEALVTIGRFAAYLQGAMFEAVIHGQARDGAAWALEWHALRQIAVGAGAALVAAAALISGLKVDRGRMAANLAAAGDGPFAEAAVFALAPRIGRAQAEAEVKAALAGSGLRATLGPRHPDLDWARLLDPLIAAGHAPRQALDFVARIRSRATVTA